MKGETCRVCYGTKEISDLANGGCLRCPHCKGTGKEPEVCPCCGQWKSEPGKELCKKCSEPEKQSTSDETYREAPERIWIDDTGVQWRNGLSDQDTEYIRADKYSELDLLLKTAEEIGFNKGYKKAQIDSHVEIEKLKLEVKNKGMLMDADRGYFEKLKLHIKQLEQRIEDMKCCGNCDQENLQSGCLISEADIIRHEYICENWKFKGKKCEKCNGKEFYYPSSNIGGSCKTICPDCKGTGKEPDNEDVYAMTGKGIMSAEDIQNESKHDEIREAFEDKRTLPEWLIYNKKLLEYEMPVELNIKDRMGCIKKATQITKDLEEYSSGYKKAQQKSQAEIEAWKKTVPTFQTIHDNLQTRIKELEQQIEDLEKAARKRQW